MVSSRAATVADYLAELCIRFKKADDLALDIIRDEIGSTTPEQFIEIYETARRSRDC